MPKALRLYLVPVAGAAYIRAMRKFIPFLKSGPAVALLRLQGAIGTGGRLGAQMNDAALSGLIERAFTRGRPNAVALVVNCPGGAPAQTSLIAARIRRLAEEKKLPVHAFVEDVAASGGYWLACAADDIWVDPNSILGSIGVISAGFGFPDLLARHGVERRLYTAGRSKALLDPFSPEKPEDVARLRIIQDQIHEGFIAHVKARRGTRLQDDDAIFSGDIWVGQKAVDLGLADGVAHVLPKLKQLYGDKVRIITHEARRPLFQRLGARALDGALGHVEERALWARFGL